jgi:hypothetical protein
VTDFRRFLGKSEEIVAPVVDHHVWLRDRRLEFPLDDGWYVVSVSGRKADLVDAANDDQISQALTKLPTLRGPLVDGLLVNEGKFHPIELKRSIEDPPLFAPLKARVWPAGELFLWDELEWEGEAEEAARIALEEDRGLGEVKGASASLRAAFAIAMARKVSRAIQIPFAAAELKRSLREIAEEGPAAAERALRALAVERAVYAARNPPRRVNPANHNPGHRNIQERVEESLRGSGARFLGCRTMGNGQVEVRWQFHGTRFISLVEEAGLRVIDSGVCLAGSDDMVTLDALPGVIREAIDGDLLVITRHAERE